MTSRDTKKEKREEEILIAALNLFVEKGYASTKTSEISKAVHISEGLLFHYFKSKEALLEKLVEIASQENDSWLDVDVIDPIAYFEQVASSVLHCLNSDETGAKFFMLIAHLKQKTGIPTHIYEMIEEQEKTVNDIVSIIEKGQKMGSIRQGDPYALAYLFSNTLQAIAIQQTIHRDSPLPEPQWVVDILRNNTNS